MKTIRILLLLSTVSVGAATLTVDIPQNDVQRVSRSFGSLYGTQTAQGSPRPATMNEVSYYTRLWIIDQTNRQEKADYQKVYQPTPLEMIPTPTPTVTATATATATPTETATPADTATPTPGLKKEK